MNYTLRELSTAAKTLVAFFTFSLVLGYGVALAKAVNTTGMSTTKLIRQYRGSDNPDDMAFAKPFEEILQSTHAHALSVPLVYLALGGLFLGTSLTSRTKLVAVTALFAGFFTEHLSLWGLRYAHEGFVYAVGFSHALSGPAYIFMCFKILVELKK